MINLLHDHPTLEDVKAALISAGQPLLLPRFDSDRWRQAAEKPFVQQRLSQICARADEEQDQPLPSLDEPLYALFHETGERLPFERVYFERRRMLAHAAVCALFYPSEARWRGLLVDRVEGILGEESWALPAHVSVPSGKDPLEIDLFCAETANLMGELITVFGPLLGEDLVDRMKERVQQQVIDNFLSRPGEFHWHTCVNNWNAVCHQGVVGAAMMLDDDVEHVARLLLLAAEGLPYVLEGYTADGGCTEGPGYWDYGFGWLSVLNEQTETRSGGRLSFFEGDEHIRAIATYGRKVTLAGGHVVNFSDSGHSVLRPQLFQYLGERFGDAANLRQARANYSRLYEAGSSLDGARDDLFNLLRLFLYCPEGVPQHSPALEEDHWFPDLQVLVARSRDTRGHFWEVAAKGGHNGECHNHNDCGSYIVQVDGRMLVSEIGAPEYDRAFFSPVRYQNLAARSLGHSVPLINGCEQVEGRDRAALVRSYISTPDEALLVLDLTECYPAEANCQRVVRTFRIDRRQAVIEVEDAIDLKTPGPVETAVITDADVRETSGRAVMARDTAALIVEPDAGTTRIDRVETLSYRDHAGRDRAVQRVILVPLETRAALRLRYRLASAEQPGPGMASANALSTQQ